MFDGTDLSLVYGDMQEPEIQQQQQQIHEPPQKIKQQPLTPAPEAIYQQQPEQPKAVYVEPQISFWDKLGQTKGDVFKLFLFALVILIAIAFDRLIFTYLKQYIEDNMMNGTHEFIIRLAYPIGVIVAIWLLKSM
jgi:hypothetical protein